MGDLTAIIEKIVIDVIIVNSKLLPQASKATQIVLMLVGGCFLSGVLLLVYALYLWMLITAGAPVAVACTGLVLMCLAGGCVAGILSYRDRKIAQVKKEIADLIQLAIHLIKDDVGEAVQENPKALMAAASLAGFFAGKKIL
jgi:hypothetical protein